ncbi:hypothetical protein [Streptomyces indiaensis]|uniref:Uncharacterized protein n=1 Tax=Streptomyces indiaensis TaxID=284033 RepID=A0ABP5QLS6_9ACTN
MLPGFPSHDGTGDGPTDHTIYPGNGTEGGLLKLKYKKGVVATLTMGVDLGATHDGTGDSVQPGASASASATAS